MKYVPCGDSGFLKYYNYCASDAECYRIVKSDAGWRRVTDSRDGTVCRRYVVSCPC